jgi:alpha-tubulin suppressor-like RCC1 family protein
VTVTALATTSRVADIACTGYSTCARLETGRVMCWGERWSSGQALTAEEVFPYAATMRVGNWTVFAILDDGEVRYVGLPGWGFANASTPTTILDDAGAPLRVRDVAMGWDHSCAVRLDGQAVCFGRDEGKSGDGTPADIQHEIPVNVLSVAGARSIAAGSSHTCAALDDGTVRCWGYGGSTGALGDGTAGSGAVTAVTATGLTGVSRVVAGWVHTCALGTTGEVHCWGGNRDGQLGLGDTSGRFTPTRVLGLPIP